MAGGDTIQRTTTPREIYEAPAPSDAMVWEMCPYLRGEDCLGCPDSEEFTPGYGVERVRRMCRGLADEACRLVMVALKKEGKMSW